MSEPLPRSLRGVPTNFALIFLARPWTSFDESNFGIGTDTKLNPLPCAVASVERSSLEPRASTDVSHTSRASRISRVLCSGGRPGR